MLHHPLALTSLALVLALTACSNKNRSDQIRATGDTGVIDKHFAHAGMVDGSVAVADTLAHGRLLFAANFNTLDGAMRPESTGTGAARLRRREPENFNRISAPDANSCAGCHSVPFVGGGGDNVANVFVLGQRLPHVNFDGGEGDGFAAQTLQGVANERNTLGMFGSGYIELLARQTTVALHALRDGARATAMESGQAVTRDLLVQGVSFGRVTAQADGTLDLSAVEGIDRDLIVKPFHQKGVVVSLREFTNNAMNHHHGMQSTERFGAGVDADKDGIADELTDGDITAATLFQATLQAPGQVLPPAGAARDAIVLGETLFASIGCATCHVPELRLASPVFTEPGPFNPVGNLGAGNTLVVAVDLTQVGPGPHLRPEADGSVRVRAYTDLKRHDMGPQLDNETLVQGGVPTSHFLTKKLWGMANEPPFMHHGRALTIDDAILMHGGEAQTARDAYVGRSADERAALVEFLQTLRVLPDDAEDNVVQGEATARIGDDPAVPSHLSQSDMEAGSIGFDTILAHGELLFAANFNGLDGAGRPTSTGTGAARPARSGVESFNRLSGPDANSCAGCHNMPRLGGGGDNVANVFVLAQRLPHVNFDGGPGDGNATHLLANVGNERNTLGMWGSGYVELLAREMTVELRRIRDSAVRQAQATGRSQRAALTAKGVSFGAITAHSNGTLTTDEVVGIDADLLLRPFHQKGVVVSLRQFTNNAMNHHHGIQSRERFGSGADPDGDGVVDELTEGDITAVTLFQAMLPVPGQVLPEEPAARRAVEHGSNLFASIGCATCHVPSLPLDDAVFTEPNPFNPVGNLRVADVSRTIAIDLNASGLSPRLTKGADGRTQVPLYSDLKRHYLGPECDNEKLVQDGVATGLFLTKKLWGMASEPPFLHHGRALTLTEAISMHGGEADASRVAFAALSAGDQAALIDFLKSLQVLPESK